MKQSYPDLEAGLKAFTRAYLASVAAVDECIGRVVDAVDNSPFKNNTIIVVTSDHGWNMGEKDYLFKNAPWEESTRVPFIIRAPGVTEPGGGSDVAGFKTTFTRGDDHWILNGEKTYISGTAECQEMGGGYFVTGYNDRSKGHRGMTAVYLPLNSPGVEVTKRFDNYGRMAISTGGFKMTDVKVPDEYQLSEVGRGFYLTMEGFDAARVLVSASCLGAAERAMEIGMEYIKERQAFGQPLAMYQGIQFDLADMAAHHEAIRCLVYKTAWMMDQRYQHDTYTALEVSKYISMCKYLAPHHALDTFRRVMLWMGAYGYTKECPLEMGIRGVMSYCIGAEGTANIQKIVIARETLGRDWTKTR